MAQQEQSRGEGCDADDDPEPLPERVVGVEPVDLGHADRGQQRGHREQVRVGLRHREPSDDVRRQVQREEEDRVRERTGGDDVLARDVDAREAEARDDRDDEEVRELSVAKAEREHHWLWPSSQYTRRASRRRRRSRRRRVPPGR